MAALRRLLLLLALASASLAQPAGLRGDFASREATPACSLARFGSLPGPEIDAGRLILAHASPMERNAVAFGRAAEGMYREVTARFALVLTEGGHGLGFVLLPTKDFGIEGPPPRLDKWEAPNVPRAFGVGFDVCDPPSTDIFDEWGNLDNMPQREVSLHWDGVEIAKRLSPVEFRDGAPHAVAITLRYVVGGALAGVSLDGVDIYRDAYIPLAGPYESRVAFGARTGEVVCHAEIDDLEVAWNKPARPAWSERVRAFDKVVIPNADGSSKAEVTLPPAARRFGRIVMSVTLEPPAGGWDPWDRCASIYAWDDAGERFEVFRWITPYSRTYTWRMDVTDYASLLTGTRAMEIGLGTIEGVQEDPAKQKGFQVSVDLDYFPGTPERKVVAVRKLWSGFPEYGNPDSPLDRFFEPREEAVPAGATGAMVRTWVTGHGMAPDGNAAEFMPVTRTLSVNGRTWESLLWKTDNYLNPCRPQGGTWKFPRAGWAPGDLVRPWDVDVSELVAHGGTLAIRYAPQHYVNRSREQGQASHWVEGQLFFYE